MANNACPSCNVPLTQDVRNRRTCPFCNTPLHGGDLDFERPRASVYDGPEPVSSPREQPTGAGWGNVRAGVGLMLFSALVLLFFTQIVAYGIYLTANRAAMRRPNPVPARNRFAPQPRPVRPMNPPRQFLTQHELGILMAFGVLAGALAAYTGMVLVCTGPRRFHGTKGAAITTLCSTVAMVMILVWFVFLMGWASRNRPPLTREESRIVLILIGSIFLSFFILATIAFPIFLRGIGRTFRNVFLSAASMAYLVLTLLPTLAGLFYYLASLDRPPPLFTRPLDPEISSIVGYGAWSYLSLIEFILIILLSAAVVSISTKPKRPERAAY